MVTEGKIKDCYFRKHEEIAIIIYFSVNLLNCKLNPNSL